MIKTLASVVFISSFFACGIDRGPHYPNNKDFGKDPKKNDPMDVTPPAAPPSEPPQTDEPTDPPPVSSGTELLGHYGFVGYFESDTVARIVDQSGTDGVIESGGLLDPVLRGILEILTMDESNERLELITKENGLKRHSVSMPGHTANGDFLADLVGDDSKSGTQTLDWPLIGGDQTRECPTPFICVDRILWSPEVGPKFTYCFRDLETDLSHAVPYAPNTQFGPDAFAASIPDGLLVGKPFVATKHPGHVTCEEQVETRTRQTFQWRVSIGNLAAARGRGFLKKATFKPLTPDSEISIEFKPFNTGLGRWWQPRRPPFVDQMSRFNAKIKYFMNSKERAFVKITHTIQTPMLGNSSRSVDRGNYSDTFFDSVFDLMLTSLTSILFASDKTTGLQVDYSFEFCGHRAAHQNLFDHCKGR
jgi:hypothetical protein